MTAQEWKNLWKREEDGAFAGWDFSHLEGRCVSEPLPWDYRTKVLDFLKPKSRLLDMGTGGGEFLLSLRHPGALTSVTESWAPNLSLCRKRLSPLGIRVEECSCEAGVRMPFADDSFDLILNRHESYDLREVRRILKNGGYFITQQAGGRDNELLSKRLIPQYEPELPAFNLENELPRFQAEGFRVMYQNQDYPVGRFLDVGALCWYAKRIPWQFPGFSVERCFDRLLLLQQELEQRGELTTRGHRFILIGKNRK